MNDLMNRIIELINKGDYLLVILVVIGAIIFNFRAIIDFFDERNKAKLSKLSDALQCEHLSVLTKAHLQEELATEHFRRTTGIRAEKLLRDALIEAHKNTNGELRFVHFKRALPYVQYQGKKLRIKITKIEKLLFIYNFIIGLVLAISGLLLFASIGFIEAETALHVVKYIGIAFFIIVVGVFMLFEALPVFSARYVRRELEKSSDDLEIASTNKSAE